MYFLSSIETRHKCEFYSPIAQSVLLWTLTKTEEYSEVLLMTVTYIQHTSNSGFGFFRILTLWKGSIYKGIWKNLFLYSLIYTVISLFYRFGLRNHQYFSEDFQQGFERWCVYIDVFDNLLPIDFMLGFYVTQVRG